MFLSKIRHLLLCSVKPGVTAKFIIQAPQNIVPLEENLFLIGVTKAIVMNTCIRQEQQKLQPDSHNLEVQVSADAEKR